MSPRKADERLALSETARERRHRVKDLIVERTQRLFRKQRRQRIQRRKQSTRQR